jgi:hypothetical protein
MVLQCSLPFSINICPAISQISILLTFKEKKQAETLHFEREFPWLERLSDCRTNQHPFAKAERLGKFTASKL